MTDIDTLLKSAAPRISPPDALTVDADVARGHAALSAMRRRRGHRRVVAGATFVVVAAATAAVSLTAVHSHGAPAAAAQRPARTLARTVTTHAGSTTHIQLVDYRGAQLPGFQVRQIPRGWHLSTSTPTALLIVPDGSTNADPNDFAAKLAVLPQSVDEQGLGAGDAVTVNGHPGRVESFPGILMLRYVASGRHTVDIQAPSALHWSAEQLVDFARGVTVTDDVGVTHG